MRVVLLCGGLGGARLAPALARLLGPGSLTVVANVGDDLEWMGLRVCPDLDSVAYALAGVWDGERGWGRRGESFHARDTLGALRAASWFAIGDRDLGLHLERARLLRGGATLVAATREISRRLGVRGVSLVPASERLAGTRLVLQDGRVLDFQEWYVRERARPQVRRTLLARAPASAAALAALEAADAVVLGPSNPVTSIGSILALRGMKRALRNVAQRVAVSPVVALRPSRDAIVTHHARARRRVLRAEGRRDRPSSIAARYARLVDRFVLDRADAREAPAIRRLGLEVVLADLLDASALARTLRDLFESEAARG